MHKLRSGLRYLVIFSMTAVPFVAACAADVSLKVEGIKSQQGNILAALCVEQEFLRNCKRRTMGAAQQPSITLVYQDVPPGVYSISLFHDENGNGKLDTGFMGLPKEGVGFSGNSRALFGPPSFRSASFVVGDKDLEVSVTVHY